ncbi:MAG: aspartate dehydrogenase [Hyphomicrobiales bacterium]|nr:aspartate dehydrogenase [Hyphomicrobiales bacterium]
MSVSERPLRLALVGWGAIGQRLAALVSDRALPVAIVAVAVRDAARLRAPPPPGAAVITTPAELAACRPVLVIEAAGRASVEPWAEAALTAGCEMIIASTSALTDDDLLARLIALAGHHGGRLTIPSGSIGAIDALSAASVLPLGSVTHRIVKPPRGWRGTAAEGLADLAALTTATVLFSGSAREAAARFPQNANATVVTALAGIGLDRTRVDLIADPHSSENRHDITAKGAFGRFEITLANAPMAGNPRSSELTALSLVHLVRNRCRAFSIG